MNLDIDPGCKVWSKLDHGTFFILEQYEPGNDGETLVDRQFWLSDGSDVSIRISYKDLRKMKALIDAVC